MKACTFHADGTVPEAGTVFVFGSNQSGIHGAGAAKVAREQFGAEIGVGEGPTGNAYALPTVRYHLAGALSLSSIAFHVRNFIDYAIANPQDTFFVTRIGCGLAGHQDDAIAPMFATAPANCSLPEPWRAFINP